MFRLKAEREVQTRFVDGWNGPTAGAACGERLNALRVEEQIVPAEQHLEGGVFGLEQVLVHGLGGGFPVLFYAGLDNGQVFAAGVLQPLYRPLAGDDSDALVLVVDNLKILLDVVIGHRVV